ncbi:MULTISPECIES: isochorismatase family protein [unclassified Gordonia (in: high G+C Gram-positive bacteria)]|uniref:isochorismatase family protein n=1 Tax=unclassified Gordonia (in: high G+C Gram-positive bacteria) TaxID=2657482 RepID=UPI0007E948CF|nr:MULTISPECIES: isochorismatase family protein [unclassified Gordonia (in: high G+C Gram-positive bacteria)]OBC05634.1 nicotinamidase [Gordonia sp. 852002-50395_SCH5434458]OBC11493.1 nicotinamidase [Gordonia sp. 852002-50816_SCH5313054-c]OBC20945.1 nicotinamidase [Gordonia sp. 852002-50816_SCH5313054-a]
MSSPHFDDDVSPAQALIVVDVQNDFCEGGALGVNGGTAVARSLKSLTDDYGIVVATRDYHIDPGAHFSDNPDFVDTWPPHCRVGTDGVAFSPEFDTSAVQEVFSKGAYSAAYSGFEGASDDGTTLTDWLRAHDVRSVDVVGIATDHCVRATAIDAANEGFDTRVLLNFTAAVSEPTANAALTSMRDAGVTLVGDLVYGGQAAS